MTIARPPRPARPTGLVAVAVVRAGDGITLDGQHVTVAWRYRDGPQGQVLLDLRSDAGVASVSLAADTIVTLDPPS